MSAQVLSKPWDYVYTVRPDIGRRIGLSCLAYTTGHLPQALGCLQRRFVPLPNTVSVLAGIDLRKIYVVHRIVYFQSFDFSKYFVTFPSLLVVLDR
jgi:hypothetical protein